VAVAVGNFDGVHLGHQALVSAAVEAARRVGGLASALTFEPHPSRILSPGRAPSCLMSLEQKAGALASAGAERLFVLRFDLGLAHQSPEQFAEVVLGGMLRAREVIVGRHFRFGRDRAGNLERLEVLGHRLGFGVRGIAAVLDEGLPISSTRIREALSRGGVEAARSMLGRPYAIEGKVVTGARRGREIGIPTANVEPVSELLPARGVYAGVVGEVGQPAALAHAVVNVGHRPTFEAGEATVVEAHLLDFEADLYGRSLWVEFHRHLREEQRFESAEALRRQILQDVVQARAQAGSGTAGGGAP
jgi:riboflavin kinase/FMN adenylyltransferase